MVTRKRKDLKIIHLEKAVIAGGLIENKCRIHVNDEVYACNDPVLFFANPLVSYAYDSLQKHRSG